jgi:hypothetical protein
MSAQTHYLKTHRLYWEAVQRGEKLFEVRKNDRFFQAGDDVYLLNYDPEELAYVAEPEYGADFTSHADYARRLWFRIGPVLQGGQFGIEPGYCVFSLLPPSPSADGGEG